MIKAQNNRIKSMINPKERKMAERISKLSEEEIQYICEQVSNIIKTDFPYKKAPPEVFTKAFFNLTKNSSINVVGIVNNILNTLEAGKENNIIH